jgi:hypothetical protein
VLGCHTLLREVLVKEGEIRAATLTRQALRTTLCNSLSFWWGILKKTLPKAFIFVR